ncbi:MAG: hypothetical protein WCF33_08435, partial [Pseudonocardiaceae bacterium]
GGLKPPPAERLRRTYLHLLHSYSHQQNPIYIGFSLLRTRRTILVGAEEEDVRGVDAWFLHASAGADHAGCSSGFGNRPTR